MQDSLMKNSQRNKEEMLAKWKGKLEDKQNKTEEQMADFKSKIEEEYSKLIETIQIQFDYLKSIHQYWLNRGL